MTMVERVSRLLAATAGSPEEADWENWVLVARLLIQEMREPTIEMQLAAFTGGSSFGNSAEIQRGAEQWRRMIDIAVREPFE